MIQIIKAKNNIWLLLILTLFLLTRFYKISEIPPSVYWDEASIGYNAFSLAQTGKDEWGDSFPLHFRAFGEFKLPVYIYITAVSVRFFGLNEFSVRIPAVVFSLGVVILTYFLAKRLSGSNMVGLFNSFFITISPWFFIFSRTGFEATAGLMFYLLAIYLFLLHSKSGIFVFFSIISFILSAYSYNSFRIIIPLTILLLLILELKNIKRGMIRWIIFSVIVLILSITPIYRLYVYDAGISRLRNVGNVSGFGVIKNYLSHFDPYFLFIQGDKNLRHQQPGFGQLYFPEVFLLMAGFIYMLKSKAEYRWLPVILVLLAPIPAAITKESPHALRSLAMVPFIHIISATGVFYLGQVLRKNSVNLAVTVVFLAFFIHYFINFLTIYPTKSQKDWQYEYKKIFTGSLAEFEQNGRILISEKGGQPYIFALFYLNYNPDKFRREVVRNPVDKWGFSTVRSFGKFEFGE